MSELKLFSFSFLFFFSGYLLRWILENKEEKKKKVSLKRLKKKKEGKLAG